MGGGGRRDGREEGGECDSDVAILRNLLERSTSRRPNHTGFR